MPLVVALVAALWLTPLAQGSGQPGSHRIRVLEGETALRYEQYSESQKKTIPAENRIHDRGRVDIGSSELEVEFKVSVRASKSSLFEQNRLAGLRGQCEIYIDGDLAKTVKMASGRMEIGLLGSLLSSAIEGAFEGEPDQPDVDFSPDSNKAEWSAEIGTGEDTYRVIVRFVYRESSDTLRYYVFAEPASRG